MLRPSQFLLTTIFVSAMGFGALAQNFDKGIAFVEAPEQSYGMCFGNNPDSAFKCARNKCAANGTLSSDCLRVKWCYPSGWSADLFVQHKEGNHWHQYLCGWNSREDLEMAKRAVCEGSSKNYLIECEIVQLWNSAGEKVKQ